MGTKFGVLLKILFLGFFSFAIGACGGSGSDDDDGGSGNDGEAIIDATNERDLGIAAMEGARQAVSSNNASSSFGLRDTAARLAYIPQEVTGICDPGTVTVDASESGATISYDMCSIAFGGPAVIADGDIVVESTTSGSITNSVTTYQDFTVTTNGVTETLDFVVECVINNDTSESTCTYESESLGLDGTTTYSVSDATVSGDDSSGWNVSVTVTNSELGSISIETTQAILFDCPGGQPSTGTLVFSDADDVVVTVDFIDCSSFSVSYSGTSNTYNY